MSRFLTLSIIMAYLFVSVNLQATCSRQRCCLSNPCTQSYCSQRNSQTWISSQNFANYQFTKLILSNNQCKPCPYDCRTCLSQTICNTCARGFYKDDSTQQCTLCTDRCTSCTVVNSISKCSSCEDGAYLDTLTQTCKGCPQGSKTCSSSTAIIDCNSGFKKSSNSLFCTPCPSNCILCPVADTICASCATGYYLNSGKCLKCTISNCLACLRSGSLISCTSCDSGFLLSTGSCNACPSNCKTCSSLTVCTACNTGYYVLGGACSVVNSAITNCLTYNSSNSCSGCDSGFYLNSNICYPCSLLCSNCDGIHFGRCSSCNSNANLFNRMCLIKNFPSTSSFNTYYSFPGSQSLITSGSPDCANHYITGTKITINLNNLRAFKLEISWKLYTRSGSSTYKVELSNSGGVTTSVYSTSSSLRFNGICINDFSTFYNLGIERSQVFPSIKKQNSLTFSTDNGVFLALQQIIVTAYRCNQLCIECSQNQCTECLITKLYTQDAYCVYTCSNDYYIYQNLSSTTNPNNCLSECPLGSYTMISNTSCVSCTPPCLTCLNEQFCLSCIDGHYLTKQNTCNETCPYRYYGKVQTKTCEKCVGRCLQCISEQQCLSCRVGFLLNTTKSCIDSCQFQVTSINGLYASLSTLFCQTCSFNCFNCLHSSTQCTQCISSKFLFDQKCLDLCPAGYFAPTGSNVCQSCEYPCKSCQKTSLNCTSCLSGYLYNSECINDCPPGLYQDNVNLLCMECDSKCSECYGASTYCISCRIGFFYYQYACNESCPQGFYPLKDSNICTDCVNLCLTCSNQTFCLSCRSNFLYQGRCISSGECPEGYFADILTLRCQKCTSPCLQCQFNSTYCTKCDGSNPNSLIYLQNNKCLSTCSSDYFYKKSNGMNATCEPCEEPCLTCSSASLCLSCISGYKYSNNICSSSCSIGTYFDTFVNDCANCPLKCEVCSSGKFCQKCESNYFVSFISSSENECVSSCPPTYYAESLSSSCQKCIFPCDTCSSSIDCVTCLSGVIYSFRCISTCPDSTLLDLSSNTCIPCQGNCLTCSRLPTYCQSCKEGYFLFYRDHTCSDVCPPKYFTQNTTKSCLQCPSTCNSCLNSTYCLTCLQNRTFMTQSNICAEYCPVGYFGNNVTQKCDKCAQQCYSCQFTSTNCISCPKNYLFIKQTFDINDCQLSCPSGYFGESSYCYECTFPCKTCLSSSKCITCIRGTFYHANSSSCLLNCPSLTFYNYQNSICQNCKHPCSSCDGSESFCLSCSNGTNGSKLYLYQGDCLSLCPSKYYADDSGVCNKCYGVCQTCSSKYYCLTCIVGYIYDGFCYSTCPLGTFANTVINSCQSCQLPCSQCVIRPNYCTKCSNSMFVYKGNCSSACPQGTYENNGQCQSCDFPCINCVSSKTCSKCLGGYLLYMNISCISDVTICPNDFYKIDSKQCAPITWCPNHYLIDQTQRTCSAQCDRKKYTNNKTGKCENSCSQGWYAGENLICQEWDTNPPISLMGMSAITYIASSYLYVEIIFNQTVIWLDVSTNMYRFVSVEQRRLLERTSRLLAFSQWVPEYTTTLQNPANLKLKPHEYPERIELQLLAYRLKSSQTGYPLQNPTIIINLPLFTPYSSEEIYSGMIVGQFSQGISWFILLLSFFFLFKNRLSDLYVLWDTVQLLYLLIFLDIQYPPNVNEFFKGLNFTHFTFIPSIFLSSSTRKASSPPFYAYSIDNSFLRNTGGLFLALIVVFGILMILKIAELLIRKVKLIKQKMVGYPGVKQFIYKGVLRYRWHHISDVMFLTYAFIIMFAFSEIYYIAQNPGHTFSNMLAILTGLVYILWVLFVAYKLNRHFKNISKGKMVNNLKCFYRGIQKQNKFGIALVLIRYARKLFYGLIISVFSTNPMFALPILMFSSVLMSLFLFINLPYKKRLSNMITLGSEVSLVIMYVLLAMINFNNQSFSPSIKHTIGWVVCLLLATTIFALIYEVFCKTMFYLEPQVDPSKIQKDQIQEKMLNDKEKEYLRKKAEEFFDSLLPRLRERLNLDEDSDDELYKNYESGDSDNSQNNEERERRWNDNQSHNSEEFKHYDNSENSEEPTTLNQKMKTQQAPHYLVRCVKEIQ